MTEPTVPATAVRPAGEHPYARDLNWLLHRVGAGLGYVQDEIARGHDMSIRSAIVLGVIAESAPLTQLALGRQLGLDKSTVVSVLDRLEAAGLIIRRSAPGDRRARVSEATPEGLALAAVLRQEIAEAEQQALTTLTASEKAQLTDLLHRLAYGSLADVAPVSGSCI